MKREVERWEIRQLRRRFLSISFPEYQREANVWNLSDRQALIDSILRGFDIASFYFFKSEDDSWECIDGRQRISTLMSFMGETDGEEDRDHLFRIRNTNEIDPTEAHPFPTIHGATFEDLQVGDDAAAEGREEGVDPREAREALRRLLNFEVTIVLLSEAANPNEFNLQFTRLNLGTPINAAEKLNAMTGDMRNLCFGSERIGQHPFMQSLGIPDRRFAKELTAAQIMAQVFGRGLQREGDFTRARHWDLQNFFKEQFSIGADLMPLVEEVARTFDSLQLPMPEDGEGLVAEALRNRAITVSLVLLAWERRLWQQDQGAALREVPAFVAAMLGDLGLLREALNSPEAVPEELLYLLDFQRHLTQAAVEKRAVRERARILNELFDRWVEHTQIRPLE